MEAVGLDARKELLCALAGPAGSLLLSFVPIPALSVCALIQGAFNLIPLMPLDGGRALGCMLELATPRYGRHIRKAVERVILLTLLVLIPALHLGLGAFGAWMLLAMRKFPCKEGRKAVQ